LSSQISALSSAASAFSSPRFDFRFDGFAFSSQISALSSAEFAFSSQISTLSSAASAFSSQISALSSAEFALSSQISALSSAGFVLSSAGFVFRFAGVVFTCPGIASRLKRIVSQSAVVVLGHPGSVFRLNRRILRTTGDGNGVRRVGLQKEEGREDEGRGTKKILKAALLPGPRWKWGLASRPL